MFWSQQQAHHMGHHQANKTDQAADRDRGGSNQGSQHDKEKFVPLDVQSQMCSAFFAQRKCIEDTAKTRCADDASKNNSAHNQNWLPACYSDPTGEPVEESLYAKVRISVERQNKCLKCNQHGIDYHTCQ